MRSYDLTFHRRAIREDHGDRILIAHYVSGGKNRAVGVDNDPGTETSREFKANDAGANNLRGIRERLIGEKIDVDNLGR